MTVKTKSEAYDLGARRGKAMMAHIQPAWMENIMSWARRSYPASRPLNYWEELLRLDKARLEKIPDVHRFPETRGLVDLLLAEREGFQTATGASPEQMAYHYNWYYFCSRRLNTRYVGMGLRANHCTAIYFPESREGGPLSGRNLDDIRRPPELENFQPPAHGPRGERKLIKDGVSSAVLCDEEPENEFPVGVWDLMPAECDHLDDILHFLDRYRDYWGPQNGIIVDIHGQAAAFEKSNCRFAWRKSPDNTAAVTACSYLIPEMKAFKEERSRLSLELRGWDETAPDWQYWTGCDQRYQRLLDLTAEAAANNPTLEDVARIVTDHEVPFPERICLAGEAVVPEETMNNWTLTSAAEVLEGPNRRTLFYRIEGDEPCYANPPFMVPGPGVTVRPEWTAGTREA